VVTIELSRHLVDLVSYGEYSLVCYTYTFRKLDFNLKIHYSGNRFKLYIMNAIEAGVRFLYL